MTKKIVGIIPAGGKSERFGGIFKELLPISDTDCGLSRCISSMRAGGAQAVVVYTNKYKVDAQRTYLENVGLIDNVLFVTIPAEGLWEVLSTSIEVDRYLFAMPDTLYPAHIFEQVDDDKLVTAFTFNTDEPKRFGVFLDDDEIVDKKALYARQAGYTAWGAWAFSQEAMDYLRVVLRKKEDLTEGLNELMKVYPAEKFHMPFYYDFASFEDYKEYLCSLT